MSSSSFIPEDRRSKRRRLTEAIAKDVVEIIQCPDVGRLGGL